MICGAGLQLIGLVLLAFGFFKTWHTHRYDDRRSLPAFVAQPLADRATAVAQRTRQLWEERPWRRDPKLSGRDAAELALGEESARVMKAWESLPDPTTDIEGFRQTVHERIQHLHSEVQQSQHALTAERAAREGADQETNTSVVREVARLEGLAHGVATGGLRWEMWGWLFLVGGLIVSTLAAL